MSTRSLIRFTIALKDALFEPLSSAALSWVVVQAIMWSLTPSSFFTTSSSGPQPSWPTMTTMTSSSISSEELEEEGTTTSDVGLVMSGSSSNNNNDNIPLSHHRLLEGVNCYGSGADDDGGDTSLPPLQSYALLVIVQLLWTALLLRAFLHSQTTTSSSSMLSLGGLLQYKRWLPISMSFMVMMLMSMFACSPNSLIPAILIFGNIGPIVSFAVDYQLWGLSINQGGIGASRMRSSNGTIAAGIVIALSALFLSWRVMYHDSANFMFLALAVGFQIIYVVKIESILDVAIQSGTMITGATLSTHNAIIAVPVLMVVVANCHRHTATMNGVLMVLVVMVVESGVLRTIGRAIDYSNLLGGKGDVTTTKLDDNDDDEVDDDELSAMYLLELGSHVFHKVAVAVGTVGLVRVLSWALPTIYLLSLFQALGVVLILGTWFVSFEEGNQLSLHQFKQCAGFAFFLTAMMLMSVLAFSHSVVLSVLIFRNVDVIRTAAVEDEYEDLRQQQQQQQHNLRCYIPLLSRPYVTAHVIITAAVTLFSNWTISSMNDVRIGFIILAIIPPFLYGGLRLLLTHILVNVRGGVPKSASDNTIPPFNNSTSSSSLCASSISAYDILMGVPVMMVLICILDDDKFNIEGAMIVLITLFGEPTPTAMRRCLDYITTTSWTYAANRHLTFVK